MYLQSNLKCYEQISTKCLKIFYFSEFSTALLTHSSMHSVKHSGRLATATALLLWRKCSECCGKKPFTILYAYLYTLFFYSFTFNLSLWWPYGCPQRLRTIPHIVSGFPHHVIMHRNTLRFFLVV